MGCSRPILLTLVCATVFGCSANSTEASVTISGQLNACYKHLRQHSVFLQPAPPSSAHASRLFGVTRDGHFKIVVPQKDFPFGAYYVDFGEGADPRGYGGLRIDLDRLAFDVGILGDCDL